MKENSIKSKTARQQLPYRKNPYWHQIHTGLSIGYSVSKSGDEGNWHVRVSVDNGQSQYKTQKIPVSVFKSSGLKDTRFEQAIDFAKENFELIRSESGVALKQDVSGLADAYFSHKCRMTGHVQEKTRRLSSFIRVYVSGNDIGNVKLSDLSRQHIEKWVGSLVSKDKAPGSDAYRKACSTANRNIATLKAILNWGRKAGLIASDSPWSHVEKFKSVDAPRDFLPQKWNFDEVYRHANESLKALMVFLSETGMRPGEPLELKCKDFDSSSRKLAIPANTKTGARLIIINQKAASILAKLADGKSSEDYIFGSGEKKLDSNNMSKLMRNARKSAGINDDFVLYSIRHAWITNAIKNGSSSIEVAKYAGTSLQMIERFYMKYDSKEFIESLTSVF